MSYCLLDSLSGDRQISCALISPGGASPSALVGSSRVLYFWRSAELASWAFEKLFVAKIMLKSNLRHQN